MPEPAARRAEARARCRLLGLHSHVAGCSAAAAAASRAASPSGGGQAAAVAIDPEYLKEKYRQERDKRLSSQSAQGQQQYISELAQSDQWSHLMADPYVEDRVERAPLEREMDVLCIGAGFGGILSAARCKMHGLRDVWLLEKGGGVGGTWYWNQYPDAACDVEGYSYMPLLEELDESYSAKGGGALHFPQLRMSIRGKCRPEGLHSAAAPRAPAGRLVIT